MVPKAPETSPQNELFRVKLVRLVGEKHALVVLAREIGWSEFERELGALYHPSAGRPGVATRLMVGLHYLKHAFDESDETVVARWAENPYWQWFCGGEYFAHELPIDPSTMTNWRKRVGPERMEKLLKETLETAKRKKLLTANDLKRVNVDTTVQEKAIAYPTDAKLYHKMRERLVEEAARAGAVLRQSYTRVSKYALVRQGRLRHARKPKQAAREVKKIKTMLGAVKRDLARKVEKPDARLAYELGLAGRLLLQKREDKGKLYSLHEPQVECIGKGKAHKKYEFGCKAALASTAKNDWIVAIQAVHGVPYDGATLKDTLDQAERLAGVRPEQAFCDKGFRGKDHWPEDVEVFITGRKGLTRTLKKWLRGRAAIEPVIGHTKSDCRMDRNRLKGTDGDKINALLAGAGFNFRKLMRELTKMLFWLVRALVPVLGNASRGPKTSPHPSVGVHGRPLLPAAA